MAGQHQVHIGHLAQAVVGGHRMTVLQLPCRNKHLGRIKQGAGNLPPHQHPVFWRNHQFLAGPFLPQRTGTNADRPQFRHGKKPRPCHAARPDPLNFLGAIVLGHHHVPFAQLLDRDLPIWCGNQRARCETDHPGAFRIKRIGNRSIQRVMHHPKFGRLWGNLIHKHQKRRAFVDVDQGHRIALLAVRHDKAAVLQRLVHINILEAVCTGNGRTHQFAHHSCSLAPQDHFAFATL